VISFTDVQDAAARIAPFVHRTPVVTSSTVDEELGLSAFFKCENLQKVGAFKARGATNAIMSLPEDEATRGVVTHSSGNHGQALAYAAQLRSIPCTVVMPEDSPRLKIEAVRGYGARVVLVPQPERAIASGRIREKTGATLIHPFDDEKVIAGQGTATLELIDEVADLSAVIAPIGGGGLLSGAAIVTRHLLPQAEIWGAEPETVDDSYRSLLTGVRQDEVVGAVTLAEGLRTGIGEITFAILRDLGVQIVTVSEKEMADATRFHLERMKLVVEPSGGVALAGLRHLAERFAGQRVGVILSGGNTDFSWL
jgi:threonine dehydratase